MFLSTNVCGQERPIDSLLFSIKNNSPQADYLNKLNTICINYYYNNESDSALKYSKLGIEYGLQHNFNKPLGDSYNICANIYFFKSLYAEALKYNLFALKISEKFGTKEAIANQNNNTGNTLNRLKRFKESLNHHNKALKIRRELKDSINIGESYNNLSNVYQNMRDFERALQAQNESIKIRFRLKDTSEIVASLNNLGNIHTDLHQYDTAIKYLNLALWYNKKSTRALEDEEISYVNLARTYLLSQNYKPAESYAIKALELGSKIGDGETVLEANDLLSKLYKETKDYKKSLYHYQEYISLRDSSFNVTKINNSLAEQYEYEYEKKSNEEKIEQAKRDAIAATEKRKQNQILILVVCVLILLIGLVIFLIRGYLQKQKTNEKVLKQSELLKEKQKEIIDSINYAKRIQTAVLPNEEKLLEGFKENLIYFSPKDIVSGDLYWYAKVTTTTSNPLELKVIAVADCTGHGVPGAFMSLLAIELLNQSVKDPTINSPSELLNQMNVKISEGLNKNKKEVINDGFDIAVCAIDAKTNMLYYAGANRPIWILRNNTIEEIKATKSSIGGSSKITQLFNDTQIQLYKGDKLYIFSDGITDQFGGADNKKYTKNRLRKFLLDTASISMQEQQKLFTKEIQNWKGETEQTDDMLLLGVLI